MMTKRILIPGFVASIAVFIGGFMVQYFFKFAAPSLSDEVVSFGKFRSWNDPIMYVYFLYPLVLGYLLTWMWIWSTTKMNGNNLVKVIRFTFTYWLVGVVPGMIMTVSSFQLSVLMVFTWTVGAFFQALFAAIVCSFMIKEEPTV